MHNGPSQPLASSDPAWRHGLSHGLLENSADAIVTVDSNQTIVDANPAAHTMFGHAPGSLPGQRLDSLIPHHARARHIEQVSAFAGSRATARSSAGRKQMYGLRSDGNQFPLEVTLARIEVHAETYFMAICRDISPQVQAAQTLREREAQYERAVTGSNDGIWDWNLRTDEVYLSPRWKRMLGYEDAELSNHKRTFVRLIHREDARRVRAAVQAHLTQGSPYEVQLRLRCKNGEYRWFYSRGQSFRDASGLALYLSGSTTDITERKLAEQELDAHRHHLEELVEQRTQDLQAATLAAQEATAARSAFLANMSHEIRTPLNAVIGFTHLLHDAEATPLQRERLGKIDRAARQLLGLVNDLLDFSKIEAGKIELFPEMFEVMELLRYASSLTEQQLKGKAVEVRIELDPAVPKYLHGDRMRLGQILGNFANNAGKFTDFGHISIEVLLVGETARHAQLRFAVTDTGIGLTPRECERLFQPFVQADASITRRYGGTGLGLALCAGLAQAMKGRIGVHSTKDKGSSFWFEVELEKLADDFAFPPTPELGAVQTLAGHVLVVDDAPFNLEVAHDLLRRLGLEVDVASDGLQAVQMCERKFYDLVLMDMQMPVCDGLTATRKLRASAMFSTLPIVAMTANATPSDAERCREAGMNEFLTKPLNIERLYSILAQYLPTGAATPTPATPPVTLPTTLGPLGRALLTMPGITPNVALSTCGDNPQQLERLLQVCLRTYQQTPAQLRADLLAHRYEDAHRAAHTVKSMAATLGAYELSAAAAQVEKALKEDRLRDAPVDALLRHLQSLLSALEGASQIPAEQADAAPSITQSEWDTLRDWVDIEDARAANWAEQHSATLRRLSAQQPELMQLLQQLQTFDFIAARTTLRALEPCLTTPP